MADLTTIKTQISALSYEDKIALSKWVHEDIQASMAANTKESMKKLDEKTSSFLSGAIQKLKLKF